MTPERRALPFATLDDVMPEVERLLASGYRRAGSWSLGQVCRHLSVAIVGSTRGRPVQEPTGPTDPESIARREAGKRLALDQGVVPAGLPLPFPALEPPAVAVDAEEVEGLRRALRYNRNAEGPLGPHPLLGPLSRADWDRFHVVHCAHHLGFLAPEERPS